MSRVNLYTFVNLNNPTSVVSNLNQNFQKISDQLDLLLARDGAAPNNMLYLLDMDNRDIINTNSIETQSITATSGTFDTVEATDVTTDTFTLGGVEVFINTLVAKGDQGDKGWGPAYALVSDGARRVLQLSSWVGGAGDEPTDNVGEYVGPLGYTSVIGDAIDIRGAPGIDGEDGADGIVMSVAAGTGIDVDSTNPAAPVVSVEADLAALEALGSTGIAVRTAANTWAQRSVAVTASTGLSVTNGNGVSGNPTLAGIDASTTVKGVSELATDAEYLIGTDATRTLTPSNALNGAAPTTLTYAATVLVDHAAGPNRALTLAGNPTIGAPSNKKTGWPWNVRIEQSGSGGNTVTWHADYDFGDFGAPVLSTGASQADLVTFICWGTKFLFLGIRKRVD